MSVTNILNAVPRSGLGKGPAKKLRRADRVPAVLYGLGSDPRPLTVDYKELKGAFLAMKSGQVMFQLRIEGEGAPEEKSAVLKDYQLDPIKQTITHADFQEVDITKPIEVEVPLILVGKPEGLERGGLLQQIRRTLTVSALPINLPEKIEVDVSNMAMGGNLHVEEVPTPEGVELVYDVNFTLATLSMPRAAAVSEEEEGEGEEGEEEGSAQSEEA